MAATTLPQTHKALFQETYAQPLIVKSLGYTGFEVQYYSAPIYTCGFVAILIFCFSSDYFKERSYHLAVACLFSVVPFAVIVGVLNDTARYGLLCVSAIGLYASCEFERAGW